MLACWLIFLTTSPRSNLMTNSQLAERFAKTLTDHDLDAFAQLLDPHYVNHNRFATPGRDGAVAIFRAFLDAFEGFRVQADDVLDAGDSVVGRFTYRGRHTGEFLGVPPSGAEIEMRSIDIWRVSGGRFVEHWDELNDLEFFQQIGAIPVAA
jgi:predicted SnoaL-like aldol condensation-catalyzing enzyme